MDRVQRLTLSKLPSLGANFPVTSTLVLRLFNLLEGSGYAPVAVNAIQRLFRLPKISFRSEEGTHHLLHHFRISIDYLRRARLLDECGRPFNLSGITSQLYDTEPSNFAFVTLLRHGILHRICANRSVIQAKRDFILLMSHLFGRRYLPGSYLENTADVIKTSASMVVLPPLLEDARRVLVAHEEEILRIFTGHALTYGSERSAELGPDTRLPLSGTEIGGTPTSHAAARFGTWLQKTGLKVVVRSLFVANSGHDDQFESVMDLARTARTGLNLNEHVIPSFVPILATPARAGFDGKGDKNRRSTRPHPKSHAHGFALNAYILDFYTHGQVQLLSEANAIRRGDVWFVLQEFDLTLITVRGVLEQLIMRKREGVDVREGEGEDGLEDLDSWLINTDDPTEKDDEDGDGDDEGVKWGSPPEVGSRVKPSWVAKRDWKLLEVVYEATEEFHEKFKAMWA